MDHGIVHTAQPDPRRPKQVNPQNACRRVAECRSAVQTQTIGDLLMEVQSSSWLLNDVGWATRQGRLETRLQSRQCGAWPRYPNPQAVSSEPEHTPKSAVVKPPTGHLCQPRMARYWHPICISYILGLGARLAMRFRPRVQGDNRESCGMPEMRGGGRWTGMRLLRFFVRRSRGARPRTRSP